MIFEEREIAKSSVYMLNFECSRSNGRSLNRSEKNFDHSRKIMEISYSAVGL